MKVDANTLRIGNIILYKGDIWTVVKTEHVKPGKGGAFAQVELKGVLSGTKLNERFRSSESVEKVRVDEEPYQFLFLDGDQAVFMHQQTFEQIPVAVDLIGERAVLLKENMEVTIQLYEGKIVSVHLPEQVEVTVEMTEPVIKGQTATGSYKPATVDHDLRVMVPPFIQMGDVIVINTEDLTYMKRADS